MTSRHRARRRGGFTLLEVIVSLAIMGVGIVAVIEAYGAAMRLSLQDEFLTTATFLASGKMEEVIKETYITAGQDEGDFGEEFPDFTWSVEIADSEIEGLELVTVTVYWSVATLDDYLVLSTALRENDPNAAAGGGGAR
ncbi:MAG TPA: type II secretion system protein [Armatimonadota bacterium]|nr:type II secretion system protein [Armatimonadota bacterium]